MSMDAFCRGRLAPAIREAVMLARSFREHALHAPFSGARAIVHKCIPQPFVPTATTLLVPSGYIKIVTE